MDDSWVSSTLKLTATDICLYHHRSQTEGTTDSAKPLVLMLHGMHDVALSLAPVAEALLPKFQPVLMDLRGHGNSGQPGAYSMEHLLFDLHQVSERLLGTQPIILFGHSLGGQLVARFSGVWPERVRASVIVEGLGPPSSLREMSEPEQVLSYGVRLLQTMGLPTQSRPLPNIAFAAERLQHNNPRLSLERATQLAQISTKHNRAGDLIWSFDPRVGGIFLTVTETQGAIQWRQSTAPTLVVGGGRAFEYWSSRMPANEDWTGRFAPGEYEARAANFADHEFVMFPDAGHMVHYDEPTKLGEATLNFLERRT